MEAIPPYRWVACGDLRFVVQVCVLRALARTQNTHLYYRTICGVAATYTEVLPLQF